MPFGTDPLDIFHNGFWYSRNGSGGPPQYLFDASDTVLGLVGPDNTVLPAFGKTYTWATLPDATTVSGAIAYVSDIAGGSYWRSNGTRWVSLNGVLTLGYQNTDVSCDASTNENVLYTTTLPAGLLGPSDLVEVDCLFTVTASTNIKTFQMRIGGSGISGTIVGTKNENGSTSVVETIRFSFANRNSVSSQIGCGGGVQGGGSSAIQTASVDFSQAQPITITGKKGVAGEVLTLNRVTVRLVKGA